MIKHIRALSVYALMLAALLAISPLKPAIAQSPDAIAAAKELMVVMKATDQYKAIIPSLLKMMKDVIVQGRPDVERDYNLLVPVMEQAMNANIDEMLDKVAGVYARNFTVEELRDITAFYRSATGQKLVERQPDIMKESMAIGQQWGRSVGAELQSRMKDELRKKGHDI
jgi:hypothetical protein